MNWKEARTELREMWDEAGRFIVLVVGGLLLLVAVVIGAVVVVVSISGESTTVPAEGVPQGAPGEVWDFTVNGTRCIYVHVGTSGGLQCDWGEF